MSFRTLEAGKVVHAVILALLVVWVGEGNPLGTDDVATMTTFSRRDLLATPPPPPPPSPPPPAPPTIPSFVPVGHSDETPPAQNELRVIILSEQAVIFYTMDGSPVVPELADADGSSTRRYTGEMRLRDIGVTTFRAVSFRHGSYSPEAMVIYRVARVVRGNAFDGYLDGCRVGVDRNRNGAIDTDLPSMEVDITRSGGGIGVHGVYTIQTLDPSAFDLVLEAGGATCVDISTDLRPELSMRAPYTSKAISPLTSLMVAVRDLGGVDESTARDRVGASVGLPAGTAHLITGVDAIRSSSRTDSFDRSNAGILLVRAAQIQAFLVHAASLIGGRDGLPADLVAPELMELVASRVGDDGFTALDMTQATNVNGLLLAATERSGINASHVDATANGIEKAAKEYQDLLPPDQAVAARIADINRQVMGSMAQAVRRLGEGTMSVYDFDVEYLAMPLLRPPPPAPPFAPPPFNLSESIISEPEEKVVSSLHNWELILIVAAACLVFLICCSYLVRSMAGQLARKTAVSKMERDAVDNPTFEGAQGGGGGSNATEEGDEHSAVEDGGEHPAAKLLAKVEDGRAGRSGRRGRGEGGEGDEEAPMMKWDEDAGEWVKHTPGRLNPPSPIRDPAAMTAALGIGNMPPIVEGAYEGRPSSGGDTARSRTGKSKKPPMNPAVIDSMSVRELKSAMDARGIRQEDCVERRELVERLKKHACLPTVARPNRAAHMASASGLDAMFRDARKTLDNPDAWFTKPKVAGEKGLPKAGTSRADPDLEDPEAPEDPIWAEAERRVAEQQRTRYQ